MLDQEKTGKFIAQTRRGAGLTQRELADRLGVSDKTISKWETGRGMPDVSVMPELCEALGVNANELLAGEKLDSEESFSQKAEEHIMELMVDNKKTNRGWRWTLIGGLAGVLLLFFFSISMHGLNNYYGMVLVYFIDIPSAAGVAGIGLIVLAAAGQLRRFFQGFALCFRRQSVDAALSEEAAAERREAAAAMTTAMRANALAGVFGFIASGVFVLHNLDDPAHLGPNVAVAMLTVFYGVLFDLILLPLRERLRT